MEKLYSAKQIQPIYGEPFEYDSENGELNLLKGCIIVTHRCTLRCKLCAERAPYYKKKYYPELNLLKKEVDKYFELAQYTMKFDVSGGEPLTRKDLPEFLLYLLKYKRKFGRMRINTNGTIIPTDELIQVLRQYKDQADVLIDNYGEQISKKAYEVADKLKKNGIQYVLRNQNKDTLHFGGWVDFGDLTKKHSPEQAKALFAKCAISSKIGFGFRIKGGLMSPCAVAIQCIEFGILEDNPEEYIDLFDNSLTIREKQEKMIKIFHIQNFTACMYCNGICDNSERFIPAEQI